MFKKIIELKLKYLAKLVLKKYQPAIVGITGSVGKTSTKEAIFSVLNKKYQVRTNARNYNNEIGVPLTVLGLESPGRSFFGWLKVIFKASKLLFSQEQNYPQILVLELGVDRPGDMKYLLQIINCRIGVVTMIGPAHLEYFGQIEKIQEEKGELIKNLPKDGWAILNYDDERTRKMAEWSRAKVLTYGFDTKAKVRAQEVIFSFAQGTNLVNLKGINFKLSYEGSTVPVLLPKVVGYNAIYAALAGASVGIAYSMNLVEISNALRDFVSPKGRMNLIVGIKNTLIIDDTYNASPQSTLAAIDILQKVPSEASKRKIAVLGDMLELGSFTEEGHRQVGRAVVKNKLDLLIVVGNRSRDIIHGALAAGMSNDFIFHFPKSAAAAKFLQERLTQGDLILVKGSQGMRMEKVVKEIMAEPARAEELLVRQEKMWMK